MFTISANDVAKYFLTIQNSENDITNLKLQKLCSYAQALSMTLLGKKLFEEQIEAWTYGPVVPSLYEKYGEYKSCPIPLIPLSTKEARAIFDDEQKFILELVNNYYGAFSAWKLQEKSHLDFPGNFGSMCPIQEQEIINSFSFNPLIIKMKEIGKISKADFLTDEFISEGEIWNALEV